MADKITFLIDPDEIGDKITTDEYLGLRKGELEAQVEVMSKFLVNGDGTLLPYEEARVQIGKVPVNQITDLAVVFLNQLTEALSPKGSGKS